MNLHCLDEDEQNENDVRNAGSERSRSPRLSNRFPKYKMACSQILVLFKNEQFAISNVKLKTKQNLNLFIRGNF